MLASINPLGERARKTRWGRTVTWYLAGSTAGGLTIGAIAGLLGAALRLASPSPTLLGVLAVGACLVGLVLDLGVLGVRRPTVHRQVNQGWLDRYRGWLYGGGFGSPRRSTSHSRSRCLPARWAPACSSAACSAWCGPCRS
jgi:hypothetical protein